MKIDTIRSGGQSQGGLDQSGGTLSGKLMLSRNPQLPLEAATKAYIDAELQTLNASNFTTGTLAIARLPAFSGDVSNDAGSNTINLSNSGVTAGEYGKIVVNEKGRATNGTVLAGSDIPNVGFDKIISDKPTTLEGYGISDGVPVSGVLMTGALNLSSNPSSSEHLITKQYVDGMVTTLSSAKTGDIVRKSYSSTPVGFLKCNGALVGKTTYPDLYAIIGDNNNTYNMVGGGKPWQYQYEINEFQLADINNWTTGTGLPAYLAYSNTIVTKNRVYMIAGHTNTTPTASLYRAVINDDGTLGAWGGAGTLPYATFSNQIVFTKNRVYILGGVNGSNTASINSILTAELNADGTLGTWVVDSLTLPGPVSAAQAFVTNSRVYLVGGNNYSTALSSVYYAPINSDGTLGAWVTDTPLSFTIASGQSAVIKNRVYLLGGMINGVGSGAVYYAVINSDGSLGTWTLGSPLPAVWTIGQTFVTKNRIYMISGHNGTAYISAIYSAAINADGTLGTWSTATSIPGGLANAQLAVTKNRIHLLGGFNGGYLASVYTAAIAGGLNDYSAYFTSDTTNYMVAGSGKPWQQQYQINTTQSGNITGWSTDTALPTALYASQAIVTKNRVYLLGGHNATNWLSTVYVSTINSDGTLGGWSATTSLPGPLGNSQAIITKNRVYLIGGQDVSVAVATIYTAPINSDGTLGSWTTGTSLPGSLTETIVVATKNRVYLFGGNNSSATISTVYTAPINADGTLGAWGTGTSLPGNIAVSQAIVTKNRVYVIGGQYNGSYSANIHTATINSDGLIGTWNTSGSLPGPLGVSQVIVTKTCVYLLGGYNGTNYTNTVYIANINTDGTLSSWYTGTSLPVILGNSQLIIVKNKVYLLGGHNGTSAVSTVYTATVSEGLNDYSAYYDGSITPLEPVNPSTLFKLPDMSTTDVNGLYHYIKY